MSKSFDAVLRSAETRASQSAAIQAEKEKLRSLEYLKIQAETAADAALEAVEEVHALAHNIMHDSMTSDVVNTDYKRGVRNAVSLSLTAVSKAVRAKERDILKGAKESKIVELLMKAQAPQARRKPESAIDGAQSA